MNTPMVDLSAFLPSLRTDAPQVPTPLAIDALRRAAHEFCTRGRPWREVVEVEMTDQEVRAAPPYTMLVAIERAEFDGRKLKPVEFADVSLSDVGAEDESRPPREITQINAQAVMVLPFHPGTLRMSIWLAPQDGPVFGAIGETSQQDLQNRVPEFLFTDWAGAIVAGALRNLAGAGLGKVAHFQLYSSRFEQAVASSAGLALRGRQRARPRVKASWF